MAITTIIAVFIAIYIPQKDRIESSKIDLFIHRYEIYLTIRNIIKDGLEQTEYKNKEEFDKILYKTGHGSN